MGDRTEIEKSIRREPRDLTPGEIDDHLVALQFLELVASRYDEQSEDTNGNIEVYVVDFGDDTSFLFGTECIRRAYNYLKRNPKDITDKEILRVLEESGVNDLREEIGFNGVDDESQNLMTSYLMESWDNTIQEIDPEYQTWLIESIERSLKDHKILHTGAVNVGTRVRFMRQQQGTRFYIKIDLYWYDGGILIFNRPGRDDRQPKIWQTEVEFEVNDRAHPDMLKEAYKLRVSTRDPRSRHSREFHTKYPDISDNGIEQSQTNRKTTLDRELLIWTGALLMSSVDAEEFEMAENWVRSARNLSDLHP